MLSRLSVSVSTFTEHVAKDLAIEVPPYEKLREYIEEIEATSLAQNTKDKYILHASNFIN